MHVIALALTSPPAVVLMRLPPTRAGVASALALVLLALAFCFWPIAGRSADEWLPVVGAFAVRRALHGHEHRSTSPLAGFTSGNGEQPRALVSLPPPAEGLELLKVPFRGESVGVLKDRRARTYAAVLAVKVSSFGLRDRSEQEARQAGWGAVLAGLAREGSPVSRIQWLERTVPADGEEVGRYLGEAWNRGTVPFESLAMQSYLDLVGAAPAVTKDHELFVCLQIDARRASRQIRRTGGNQGADAGACAVLLRELEALGDRLGAADVRVVGAIRPGMLASTLRVAF